MKTKNETYTGPSKEFDAGYYHDIIWYPDRESLHDFFENYKLNGFDLKYVLKEHFKGGELKYRLIIQ